MSTEVARRCCRLLAVCVWVSACGDSGGGAERARPGHLGHGEQPGQMGQGEGAAADDAPTAAQAEGDAWSPAEAGGAGGASGMQRPAPALEQEPRTGVFFDWPETDPDDVVECEPGRYVGMFSCPLYIVTQDGVWDMVGNLDGFPGSCAGTWSATRVP